MDNQQETKYFYKNELKKVGSSETTREAPLTRGWRYSPLYTWKYVFGIDLAFTS